MIKCKLVLLSVLLALLLAACGSPRVPAGELGWTPNPDYRPGSDSRPWVGDLKQPGYQLGAYDLHAPVTVIQAGQFGIAWNNEVLEPGTYNDLPNVFVTVYNAAVVANNLIGVSYNERTGKAELLQPGTHNARPESVVFFPAGTQRYRTIASSLLGDANACASFLCESSITKAIVKDTDLQATIDVDVVFEFCARADCADALWQLRDSTSTVQNVIGTTLRSSRELSAIYTKDELVNSAETRALLEADYLKALNVAVGDKPINILSVNIRDVVIGGVEFQQAQANAQATQVSAEQQATLVFIESQRLTAEQAKIATQEAFARGQKVLDAQNKAEVLRILLDAVKDHPETMKVVIESYINSQYPPPTPIPTVTPHP